MTKKYSKSEIKFMRNLSREVESLSKENVKIFFNTANPIFIPKRKKRK